MPKKQSKLNAAAIGVYQLQNPQGTTFLEMALATLKTAPDGAGDVLAQLLKEQDHTFTLPGVENLVKRQEGGEDVGLLTDGWANFAFLEDADGSVSVFYFDRDGDEWRDDVYRLGYGHRWPAGCRLLLRNSDALTL